MKVVQVIEYYYFMCRLSYLIVCWSWIRSPGPNVPGYVLQCFSFIYFSVLNNWKRFVVSTWKVWKLPFLHPKKERKSFLHTRYSAIIQILNEEIIWSCSLYLSFRKVGEEEMSSLLTCLVFETFKVGNLLLSLKHQMPGSGTSGL